MISRPLLIAEMGWLQNLWEYISVFKDVTQNVKNAKVNSRWNQIYINININTDVSDFGARKSRLTKCSLSPTTL